jgi:hypothetical protein
LPASFDSAARWSGWKSSSVSERDRNGLNAVKIAERKFEVVIKTGKILLINAIVKATGGKKFFPACENVHFHI